MISIQKHWHREGGSYIWQYGSMVWGWMTSRIPQRKVDICEYRYWKSSQKHWSLVFLTYAGAYISESLSQC